MNLRHQSFPVLAFYFNTYKIEVFFKRTLLAGMFLPFLAFHPLIKSKY